MAEDLVKHWEARYAAMEGRAMVVCMSRRICVELYKAIQKLRPHWHHGDDDKGVRSSWPRTQPGRFRCRSGIGEAVELLRVGCRVDDTVGVANDGWQR
jgi:hypothetical protein